MISALIILFYFLTPFLILHLCHQFPFVNKLGAILLAYLAGILIGIAKIIPPEYRDLQELIMTITVPLALPLMLFSSDIRSWSKMAGKTFLSMIIAIVGLLIFIITGYLIFKENGASDLWKIGGLLVGLYTGGTPNLASLKLMLEVKNEPYLITNTYDMLISTIYFLFLISLGKNLFARILPVFRLPGSDEEQKLIEEVKQDPYWGLFRKKNGMPLLKGFLLSVLIFAVAGSLTMIVPPASQMLVVILTITTLGILASFVPAINKLPKTFELGMYLILVFSIDVASLVDITEMFGAEPKLFYYITYVIFGALFFHVLASRFFKIDRDTVMVTSTALICSPPFVPAVAGAIKNKNVVVSGLTVGIIGYAIGNYLGVVIAELLKIL
jgi:uncharacterized membrane protein